MWFERSFPQPQGISPQLDDVANRTIGGTELASAVIARAPGHFYLLVPLSPEPMMPLCDGPDGVELATAELLARAQRTNVAEQRLAAGLQWLRSLGAAVEGEVAPVDPVAAIAAVVARGGVDEVIVSTLPKHLSRWLKQDLPNRLRRALPVPVVSVSGIH
jgi:hypothetical protein